MLQDAFWWFVPTEWDIDPSRQRFLERRMKFRFRIGNQAMHPSNPSNSSQASHLAFGEVINGRDEQMGSGGSA
jgi:hypothetical protein